MEFLSYFYDWFIRHASLLLLFVAPVYILFRLIQSQVLPRIFKSAESRKRFQHYFYRFRVLFWFVSFLIYLLYSFSKDPYSTVAIVLVAGVSLYGVWRDFFLGLYLRFEGRLTAGQLIENAGIKGKITAFLWTKLRIQDATGNVHMVHYSQFYQDPVVLLSNEQVSMHETLIFPIAKRQYADIETSVRLVLQSSPWILVERGIDIAFVDGYMQVQFRLIEKEAKGKVKAAIESIIQAHDSQEEAADGGN